jgi:hypothetical protein
MDSLYSPLPRWHRLLTLPEGKDCNGTTLVEIMNFNLNIYIFAHHNKMDFSLRP